MPDSARKIEGRFEDEGGERWYRIDGCDRMPPFFAALSSDSDLWAFVSTAGSLAAGRRDPEGSFFPYETVDKIHARWESIGPRTWIRIARPSGFELWEPFARRPGARVGRRSALKNLTGTRLAFEEAHPDGRLVFRYEWSSNGRLGLIRKASLRCADGRQELEVLDGLVGLLPAGLSNASWKDLSYLADAYAWNEGAAGGRLGIYTMYARLWDRAEPKESFEARVAWRSGPEGATALLSDRQVVAFCEGLPLAPEAVTRGRRGAFLLGFALSAGPEPASWYQVLDGPLSQAKTADLAAWLEGGGGGSAELEAAMDENDEGVRELLAKADGFQSSGLEMSAAHHTADVLYNIMRGGVFVDGTAWDKEDLLAFARARSRALAPKLEAALSGLPRRLDRAAAMAAVRGLDPQLERLTREYLPLTFSRRHGDPSRPWNGFSIRVRDEAGGRVVDYQGNWRDIFQNWEALLWTESAYVDSMISTFLSAMTVDGYNPYRIGRDGIDWEVLREDDPWSFIGYWGDHQVIYLLKFLEAAEATAPGLLEDLWKRPAFAFADVPYRLRGYDEIAGNPRSTIEFDREAHERIMARAEAQGGDGKLVPGADGHPVLGSMAEKLVAIVLSKAGNMVPGGGIWLNTQRPEWNDANNALVGCGLSIVSLAALRRLLAFLRGLPFLGEAIALPEETALALEGLAALAGGLSPRAASDPALRGAWLDGAGRILEAWRKALYRGWTDRRIRTVAPGLFLSLVDSLLPSIDAGLRANLRTDGLYHSYNLLRRAGGGIEIDRLYPMLEGQVALLSSGLLSPAEALDLGRALERSELYDAVRDSYLLYPDRRLPGFLEKNVLDVEALALPAIRALVAAGRGDILEAQRDGTLRFASRLANRGDVEAALAGADVDARAVADCYERIMRHREFTGRSGTMFGFEGLGCVYWHMVAKLLLAVQEAVFAASDLGSPRLPELIGLYRSVRSGFGYMKTAREYGAFPFDPYSHTPAEGGAQQPGMTGQVKEEILARWGELGLRWKKGMLYLDPVIVDPAEVPPGASLEFTYRRIPFAYRRSPEPSLRVLRPEGWAEIEGGGIPLEGALRVEAGLVL